ncbi:MAG: heme lyase CcmF/NrfE family subunit [Actinomycetota bacterium]
MTSLAGLGRPSLMAAVIFCVASLVLSWVGAARRRADLKEAGARALYVTAGLAFVGAIALVSALFAHDFSLRYVVNYSSRSLPGPYMLAALWGGMEGSLLFWTLLLTAFASAFLLRRPEDGRGFAAGVLAGIALFFLGLLVFAADPFARLADVPVDGRGLNPLLQSPGMLVHPPLLYTGFVGFSIPFALAIAALLRGSLTDSWFTTTRRWTLLAWSALSIGIVLGGAWAYTELGWGGYWAWDPVENASFMPWLTATAFLHSVVIQERRRMFKMWNVVLILLTYVLAVFGTFLTRSGLLSSIHTFTEGPIGKWFLPFLAAMLLGGLALVALRSRFLRGENRLESALSRESAFLFNNVLFVAAAFTVFWGTIYPVVHELLSGVRLSVGPPFFNAVFIPIGLALLALTGIGPLISWRGMTTNAFGRVLRTPLIAGTVVVVAAALLGVRSVGALLAFGLCGFTSTAVGAEFVRGSRIFRRRERIGWFAALARTLMRNRRRYGGYVVHLGVVLIVIGLSGAAFRTERHALLDPGESMMVGSYRLTYQRARSERTPEKQIFVADIAVQREGRAIGTLAPQRNFHLAQRQAQSEVAIRSTPIEDLYVVVTSFDRDGSAAVRSFVNPLTWWIWVGAAVMLGGMVVLISGTPGVQPATRKATTRLRVPSAREPDLVAP